MCGKLASQAPFCRKLTELMKHLTGTINPIPLWRPCCGDEMWGWESGSLFRELTVLGEGTSTTQWWQGAWRGAWHWDGLTGKSSMGALGLSPKRQAHWALNIQRLDTHLADQIWEGWRKQGQQCDSHSFSSQDLGEIVWSRLVYRPPAHWSRPEMG